MLEEIRRLAAAIGLPDFQYFSIPAAVPDLASEVAGPEPDMAVVAAPAPVHKEPELAGVVITSPDPYKTPLSIVRSVELIDIPITSGQTVQPFLLLADIATVVASAHSTERPRALTAAESEAPSAMSRRVRSGGRVAGVGRR